MFSGMFYCVTNIWLYSLFYVLDFELQCKLLEKLSSNRVTQNRRRKIEVFFRMYGTGHTIKPGLAPLAWHNLKVGLASILAPKLAPKVALKLILALLQKLAWPQIWPLKNGLPQISEYDFSLNFRFMSLFIHLFIHLENTLQNINYQHMHQSI